MVSESGSIASEQLEKNSRDIAQLWLRVFRLLQSNQKTTNGIDEIRAEIGRLSRELAAIKAVST